jgi:hypothetical protein
MNISVKIAKGHQFGIKKFCGHFESMSSSRRAQTVRQSVIITGDEGEPIQFSPLLFARKLRRYLEELVMGFGPSDIVINEQRVIIRFLHREGVAPDEIHTRLRAEFGDDICGPIQRGFLRE